uniref:DUF569 domain-containing protein n=1 Tax=Aegilops tauschii TaxID=37682 RepID=R7WGD2_AEGTA
MWLDVRAGLGRGVLLLNAGDRYLRANGKYLRWNTGVTVESRDIENEKVSSMMRWIVEPIDLTERAPRIPDPIRARLPEDLSVVVFGRQPGAMREIRFVQASDEGLYNEAGEGWAAFHIRGRSLYNLRDRLAREVDQQPDGIAMCVRAGRYGRLTPLVVDLPRRGWGDIFQIVVFISGTAVMAKDQERNKVSGFCTLHCFQPLRYRTLPIVTLRHDANFTGASKSREMKGQAMRMP